MTNPSISRRQFGKLASATFVSAAAVGAGAAEPASNRVAIGVIGAGARGFNLIDTLLNKSDAQIIGVCDVDSLHYRDRPWGKGTAFGRLPAQHHIEKAYANKTRGGSYRGILACSDYRELCARDDIDAIVIATPDHWHALCALEALRQGKDVYCEKPITHQIQEGQAIRREVAARGAIFQTGSQQRSSWEFRRAVELARGGYLGALRSAEVGLPSGYDKPQGETSIKPPPESLDYEMWCGPAPKLPYMRARHHRWWRGTRAYGGGVLMDWIGHHNDITHWALGAEKSGPLRIEAVNWEMPETEIYDTPWHYEIRCEYNEGVFTSIADRHPTGTKIIGEEGWVFVTRGKIIASDKRLVDRDFQLKTERVERSDDHMQNFLDGIKKRRECIAPAEIAHRSIMPGYLGYVSNQLGRALTWDPVNEQVAGDEEAQKILYRNEYREPWSLS